ARRMTGRTSNGIGTTGAIAAIGRPTAGTAAEPIAMADSTTAETDAAIGAAAGVVHVETVAAVAAVAAVVAVVAVAAPVRSSISGNRSSRSRSPRPAKCA